MRTRDLARISGLGVCGSYAELARYLGTSLARLPATKTCLVAASDSFGRVSKWASFVERAIAGFQGFGEPAMQLFNPNPDPDPDLDPFNLIASL